MTASVAILVLLAIPFLAVWSLLAVAERLEDRRELTRYRQIELTDAIHRELGAVAAPVMRRRFSGEWLVSMTVPLDRPALVASILQLTGRHFAALPSGERFQVVLTPDTSHARPRAVEFLGPRQAETDRPIAA